MVTSAQRTQELVLVTSARQILLIDDGAPSGRARLPRCPVGATAAIAFARTHLDGEISGYRVVALLDTTRGTSGDTPRGISGERGAHLGSARLVGHRVGTWSMRPAASSATVRVVEARPEDVAQLLAPGPAFDVLAPLAAAGYLLDLLIGSPAAADL